MKFPYLTEEKLSKDKQIIYRKKTVLSIYQRDIPNLNHQIRIKTSKLTFNRSKLVQKTKKILEKAKN